MRSIHVSREINAPLSAVWDVLADFPNIARWNTGVKTSFATSEAIGGVGATRHCDLAPAGALEETIREWQPETKLVISIDSVTKLPIKSALVTFELEGDGGDWPTTVGVIYAYDTKLGPIGRLLGPLLDRQLTKGFTGFLADLDAETAANS
jgi:uncharacterized protein YndB with AHSA1/START domain